jgi:hypothetical protein
MQERKYILAVGPWIGPDFIYPFRSTATVTYLPPPPCLHRSSSFHPLRPARRLRRCSASPLRRASPSPCGCAAPASLALPIPTVPPPLARAQALEGTPLPIRPAIAW